MKKIISFFTLLALTFTLYMFSPVQLYAKLFIPLAPWLGTLILALLSAYFFTVALWAWREKKIHKANVIAFYILYFVFLIYTLYFRNGFYGLNLNPLNVFDQGQDLLIVLLNLILFVPVGFLLKPKWQHLLLMAFIIFLIESLQYLLKVGFADINDWLSNLLSVGLGLYLKTFFQKRKIEIL